MKKKFLFIILILFSFSSCKFMSHIGENLDSPHWLNDISITLIPYTRNENGEYVYKKGDTFSLVFSGELKFYKYDYYDFRAYFTGNDNIMSFLDEGNGLIDSSDCMMPGGIEVTHNHVHFILNENNCKDETKIGENSYSFIRTVNIEVSSTGSSMIMIDILANDASASFGPIVKIFPEE